MSNEHPRIGIVVSRADRASERIGEQLLEKREWEERDADNFATNGFELRRYDDIHLDLEDVASDFDDPSLLVFVSRHSGDTGPLLSAHFTGNFGDAEFGGDDHRLAPACPNAQKVALHALETHAPDRYEVCLECTHHGPSDPGAPAMFVELGSRDEQWDDPAGAAAVAGAVLDLEGTPPSSDRTIVAFGGSHYAPRPTRIVRETDWACGHIAADWGLDELGNPGQRQAVVDQVFARSSARHAIVEGDRPDLRDTIAHLGYRIVSETWVRETDGVPLHLVERLETALCPVDDGLRFGDATAQSRAKGVTYTVIDLPEELLADANGVDMGAITNAAQRTSVAYETRENGNRVGGRAAFPAVSNYDSFIDEVCDVLDEKYDEVEREDAVVVVHETAFDPERAATLGVPEGPKYGALAAGRSVEVDGQTVNPSDVTVERTRRYPW